MSTLHGCFSLVQALDLRRYIIDHYSINILFSVLQPCVVYVFNIYNRFSTVFQQIFSDFAPPIILTLIFCFFDFGYMLNRTESISNSRPNQLDRPVQLIVKTLFKWHYHILEIIKEQKEKKKKNSTHAHANESLG